jgi:hypothetical protein
LKKRAIDLVRLALFQEQRRMPLRRDEISKKVLGSQRGDFQGCHFMKRKLSCATPSAWNLSSCLHVQLRMMLPLRAKTRIKDKAGTQNGEHAGERQMVTGLKKKGANHAFF